ncbi:MAG TPA: cytochrome c [Longimicrobiales bacterium]|nr:cytochrome c [Longimicrobiales bacterium]
MSATQAKEAAVGRILVFCVGILWIGGCGPPDGPPEESGPTGADSVRAAEQMFSPEAFDTITWETHQARLDRGAVVWRISCTKCHGNAGRGDGGFVTEGDTLRPPSFVEPDWVLADDVTALRRRIYTGTEEGMPHWGLEGLTYRDIDAVATYILEAVRAGVDD